MKRVDISLEKENYRLFEWGAFLPALLISITGLLSIYSATRGIGGDTIFYKQAVSFVIGVAVMMITMFLPKKLLESLWIAIFGLSIVSLILVLIIGDVVYGTKGWIKLGTLSVQPAEFAKLGVILALAGFLSKKGIYIGNLRDVVISLLIVLLPFILIWMQPDHGSASVLLVVLVGVLFWSGFNSFFVFVLITMPLLILMSFKGFYFYLAVVSIFSIIIFLFKKRILITLLVLALYASVGLITPAVYNNLQSHQKARIETFINPTADPLGSGYNVLQSVMAVGSGGWTGKGLFQGSQTQLRYIPMQWTDFIFSVPTEELGFLGGTGLILLYLWLISTTIKIANETDSRFNSLACFGIATVFMYHIIINIGMVIGLTPVMGLPLPFMSYGGTSLIINFLFVGIILNSHRVYIMKRNN